MTLISNKMLLDKISIFNKTKLNIAKAIAPIKQTSVISFKQVEFEISQPKRNTAVKMKIDNFFMCYCILYFFIDISI